MKSYIKPDSRRQKNKKEEIIQAADSGKKLRCRRSTTKSRRNKGGRGDFRRR
jgi:hypothetical protein